MEEKKDKNKKRFNTVYRVLLLTLILINLSEHRYKKSAYYEQKVFKDISVAIKEDQFANIKIMAQIDDRNYEMYEYTDLDWWDKHKKESVAYQSNMHYESDIIKRKQNNELFEPYQGILQSINELEKVKIEDGLVSRDIQLEIVLEANKLKKKDRTYRLIGECYLDEEIILFRLDKEFDERAEVDSGYRMDEGLKVIIENMIDDIVSRKVVSK